MGVGEDSNSHSRFTKYMSTDESTAHVLSAYDINTSSLLMVGNEREGPKIEPHIHWDGRYQFNLDLIEKDFNNIADQSSSNK